MFHYLFSRILCPFFVSFDAVLNGTLPSLPSPAFVISNYRHPSESSGDSFEYANRFAFPSRWQYLKNQHRWWDCQLEWGTLTSVVIFVVEVVVGFSLFSWVTTICISMCIVFFVLYFVPMIWVLFLTIV